MGCVTYNKKLLPTLKKAPDKRSVGTIYIYIPETIMMQPDGLSSGAKVRLVTPPEKGDIICNVSFKNTEYTVLWKDLVRLT